jgi:hypothetical protein
MGLQAAVHLGHMPWALTKEEEGDRNRMYSLATGTENDIRKELKIQSEQKRILEHKKIVYSTL